MKRFPTAALTFLAVMVFMTAQNPAHAFEPVPGMLVYLDKYGRKLYTDKPVNDPGFVLVYPRAADEAWKPKPLTEKKKRQYDVDISYAARSYGVEQALIKAIIHAESLFDPAAVSRAGAQGLMQLMPRTAAMYNVFDPFDARQNIMAGTQYIKYLLEKFDYNLTLAVAAYNAGEGNVRRYGGVPPFEETRHYVKKVKMLLHRYRNVSS